MLLFLLQSALLPVVDFLKNLHLLKKLFLRRRHLMLPPVRFPAMIFFLFPLTLREFLRVT